VSRRGLIAVLAALAALALVASVALASGAPALDGGERADPDARGYIVVYERAVRSPGRETDTKERAVGFESEHRYSAALEGFSAELSERQVAELRADPEVAQVVPDRMVYATAALAPGETVPSGVRRIGAGAPGASANDAAAFGVAVLDTGVDLTHPDLDASVVDGVDCIAPGTSAHDENGHGTHVAGTIAAENDGAGVVGVAPGTRIHAVRVLNASGSGSWSQIICGIDWVTANAAQRNIKVANMSLGGRGSSLDNGACGSTSVLHQALCNSNAAGVRYAVAAGNSGWSYPDTFDPDVPAAYDEVVTVTAASDSDGLTGAGGPAPSCRSGETDDRYASFSNYSNNATDNQHTVAAPGVCIRSTWPTALSPAGGYHTISGTSMATPHVAGALARCFSNAVCTDADPPAQLIAKIASSEPSYGFAGDPSRPLTGRYFGFLALAGTPPPPPPSFTLAASPPSQTVKRGSSTSYTVTVNPQGGFASPVTVSVSGLRSGASATFSANPATSSSTMTVRTTSTAFRGTFTLTLTGKGGGLTRKTTVTLQVTR
jgi:subtilisin